MAGLGSTIKVSFLGDASDLAKAAKKASTAVDGVSGSAKKAGKDVEEAGKKGHSLRTAFAGLGGAALGAGLVEFGKKAVEAAVEGQQAHARLAQAVKNAGGSLEEVEPKVAKLSTQFAKLGFTNDEVEAGLANMTTSLRDPEKALGAMGLAADLAKFKNISLSDASTVVAKAMEGQLRPLKQLGIDLPVSAGGALKLQQANDHLAKAQAGVQAVLEKYPDAAKNASKHHAQYETATNKVAEAQRKLGDVQNAATAITKGLAAAVGGQASAAAGTYAGKVQAMHAQFENLTEEVGAKLLPQIVRLMNGFSKLAAFVERNRKVVEPLAKVVAGLVAVFWVAAKAAKAFEVVMTVLDIELAANPVGLVVVALAALGAGMVLLWKHSQTFRTIVTGAFKAVGGIVLTLVDAWLGGFQLIAEGMSHLPFIGDKFKGVAQGIQHVRDKIGELKGDLDNLGKNVTRVPVVIDVNTSLGKAVQSGITAKRDRLDGARASGGPVDAGGAYLVGERGPEVFIPTRSGRVASNASLHLARAQVVEHTTVVKLDTRVIATAINRFNAQASANGARLAV